MSALDRGVLYLGVWLAVILAALSLFQIGKIPREVLHAIKNEVLTVKGVLTPPTIDFELMTANPPVCSASTAWPDYIDGNMMKFTTQTPGHTFAVQFPQDVPPLEDSNGARVSSIPNITSGASSPTYTVVVDTSGLGCGTSGCYYPYSVTMDGKACESKNPPTNSYGMHIKPTS